MTAVATVTHPSFEDPYFTSSIDSFEGVPDYVVAAGLKTPVKAIRSAAQHRARGTRLAQQRCFRASGLAVIALAYVGSSIISDFIGVNLLHFKVSPLSPIIVAVAIGLLIRNTIGVPTSYEKGLRLCLRGVLRLGIVLLGMRLGLVDAGSIGLRGLPIIIITISTAITVVTWLNNRLGLSRRLGVLIAVGTSICGVSAIVATGAAIDAEEDEMSYAVSCITLFGLMCLFVYPFYSHWMFNGDAQLAGIFMGHEHPCDVAQTTSHAGVMYKQQLPLLNGEADPAAQRRRRREADAERDDGHPDPVHDRGLSPIRKDGGREKTEVLAVRADVHHRVPRDGRASICWRFLVATKHQSSNVQAHWASLISQANAGANWCLILAMAAVGLGTGLAKLKNLGIKPFCVGFTAAILVGGVSTILVKLFASFLH